MFSTSFVNFWGKTTISSISPSSSPRANCTHKIKYGRKYVRIFSGSLFQRYNNMKTKCPNFDVCYKMRDSRLKVCSNCFWRFENEILEFKDDMECPVCLETRMCVRFRKCTHFVCASLCFPRLDKCPMCSKLKEAGISLSNE